jgi:hypothetical protein
MMNGAGTVMLPVMHETKFVSGVAGESKNPHVSFEKEDTNVLY